MKDKSSLRIEFQELLNRQRSEERLVKSQVIADKVFALPVVQAARTILFYASLPGEVETFAMIEKAVQLKKQVALPVLERDQRKMIPTLIDSLTDLEKGTHGIHTPRRDAAKTLQVADLDVVIVPGLGFDKANNRLGRGAGYYDRFLSVLPKSTATVGLAFDFQLVDRLPTEGHDVPLQFVIAN